MMTSTLQGSTAATVAVLYVLPGTSATLRHSSRQSYSSPRFVYFQDLVGRQLFLPRFRLGRTGAKSAQSQSDRVAYSIYLKPAHLLGPLGSFTTRLMSFHFRSAPPPKPPIDLAVADSAEAVSRRSANQNNSHRCHCVTVKDHLSEDPPRVHFRASFGAFVFYYF